MPSPALVCKAGTEAKTLSKCITRVLVSRFPEFIFKYISYFFFFSANALPFPAIGQAAPRMLGTSSFPSMHPAQGWCGKVAPDTPAERGLKRPWGSIRCCLEQAVWDLCRNMETLCPKASVLVSSPPSSANRATASSLCCWLKQVHLSWFSCCLLVVSHWPGTLPPAWEPLELLLRSGEEWCGPLFQRGWKQMSAVKGGRPVSPFFQISP